MYVSLPLTLPTHIITFTHTHTQQHAPGCVAYSLAVSVKMNVLLFAPALALVLVQALGACVFSD